MIKVSNLLAFSRCSFFNLIRQLSVNSFTFRTNNCGDVGNVTEGNNVKLYGWVQFKRLNKFILLRDAYGSIQLYNHQNKNDFDSIPLESVISIDGVVQKRPKKDINPHMINGDIEISVNNIQILNRFEAIHPFKIQDYQENIEKYRLKYRYFDLRSTKMQNNLRLRSNLLMDIRRFLIDEAGFIEVETPIMHSRTPGGAQEFIVPSRHPNLFYSLTQSPQQFKQLLMVGGIDRYFQVAKCFRDEGAKPDRQPEFTQLDLELSFTTSHDIMNLVENILKSSWPKILDPIKIPFPRLKYHDAIRYYASDKPDLRSDLMVNNITNIFKSVNHKKWLSLVLRVENVVKTNQIVNNVFENIYHDMYFQDTAISVIISDDNWSIKQIQENMIDILNYKSKLASQLMLKRDDLLFIIGGDNEFKTTQFMGKFRNECIKALIENNLIKHETKFSFVWVVDFPLFFKNNNIIEPGHHPFTAPKNEYINLIYSNPLDVIGQHFDLILNGNEIGGGSMRINNHELQRYILCDILNEEIDSMDYFINALKSGCPPHGGIALGIDRLIARMINANSIRDVIAFPKSHESRDSMSNAPSPIPDEVKKLYHIKEDIDC